MESLIHILGREGDFEKKYVCSGLEKKWMTWPGIGRQTPSEASSGSWECVVKQTMYPLFEGQMLFNTFKQDDLSCIREFTKLWAPEEGLWERLKVECVSANSSKWAQRCNIAPLEQHHRDIKIRLHGVSLVRGGSLLGSKFWIFWRQKVWAESKRQATS